MTKEEHVEAVITIILEGREMLLDFSKRYSWSKCPLKDHPQIDHDDWSQFIMGLGAYEWKCPFCGEQFDCY